MVVSGTCGCLQTGKVTGGAGSCEGGSCTTTVREGVAGGQVERVCGCLDGSEVARLG